MTDLAGAAAEFATLAKNLQLVGAVELRAELYKAIDDAARPVLGEIRTRLVDYMPNPYAEVLDQDLRLSLSRRTGRDPGVRLTATGRGRGGVQRRRLRRLEGGVLAHPLYGNRRHWYNQTSHVVAGFFSGPIQDSAPQVRDAILAAMDRVANKALGR